jgi:sialate O-acetylesterase
LVQAARGELRVTYAAQALLATSDGGADVLAFEVEAADGTLHAATAQLLHNQVDVQVPFVGEPRALCYAFSDAPAVNLINSAGLPAEPFRWPLDG